VPCYIYLAFALLCHKWILTVRQNGFRPPGSRRTVIRYDDLIALPIRWVLQGLACDPHHHISARGSPSEGQLFHHYPVALQHEQPYFFEERAIVIPIHSYFARFRLFITILPCTSNLYISIGTVSLEIKRLQSSQYTPKQQSTLLRCNAPNTRMIRRSHCTPRSTNTTPLASRHDLPCYSHYSFSHLVAIRQCHWIPRSELAVYHQSHSRHAACHRSFALAVDTIPGRAIHDYEFGQVQTLHLAIVTHPVFRTPACHMDRARMGSIHCCQEDDHEIDTKKWYRECEVKI
jgi:hypothetical protein